jgi:hypothetical protein
VTSIASGAVVNADINASAAIAHSKLASMSSGNILVGSSGSVPTSVAVTGDVTVNSSGTTTIGSGAVTFAKMQTISDYQIIGRNSGLGAGSPQSITCSSFAFSLLEDGDASSARSTLGLGSMATQSSGSVSITGGTVSNVSFGSGISFPTPLIATSGGTGFGAYTIGDILYANTASTLQKLPDVATGNVLISGGVGAIPAYGKVGLTTHVSGTLPVANGGTGVTAASTGSGGVVLSTSPTLVTPVLGTPAAGSILTNCTGLPLTAGVTGTLPVANGGTGVTQSAYAESYISTSAATTYSATNTWYKISGSTTLATGENFDDVSGTNNRIRYTGTAPRAFFITVCGTVTGTNANTILVGLYVSGAHMDASITAVTISGTLKHQISSQAIVVLDTNDYIEVHTQNQSSTNSATFERLNICAHALV